jgi:hypothetical protein
MNILTGNRNARQYVEPDDHRRGYSIRPAYRPEPVTAEMRINAVWALVALVIIGAVFGLCVALVR